MSSDVNALMLFLASRRTSTSASASASTACTASTSTSTSTSKSTHTGMYFPLQGAYTVTDPADVTQFWILMNTFYETFRKKQMETPNGGTKSLGFGLTEVQQEQGSPLLIDVDFKYNGNAHDPRKYDARDVSQLLDLYAHVAASYVADPSLADHAWVFEKPKPRAVDGSTQKDGFHAMFPDVVLPKPLRCAIHARVKKLLGGGNGASSSSNNGAPPRPNFTALRSPLAAQNKTLADIIDTCAATNNWFVYGCGKRNEVHAYTLTYDYDRSTTTGLGILSPVDSSSGPTLLPSQFTIRDRPPSPLHPDLPNPNDLSTSPLSDEANAAATTETTPPSIDAAGKAPSPAQVKLLLDMLNPARADDEPEWIRVGWCLHNVLPANQGLPLWTAWSRQSTKFVEGECDKRWDRFRADGYQFPSLCNWARNDSPDRYAEYIQENSREFLEYSINCGAHYDIASILYMRYKDVYKAVNPKRPDEWYAFQGHRWHEMPGGFRLMNILSNDISKDFASLASTYKRSMIDPDQNVIKAFTEKRNKCLKLEYQVKDNGFKTGVLKECARLFFDEHFLRKVDTDINLLCFENGVFDAQTQEFRDGQPDDYVSKSTGVNYVRSFSYDHPVVQEIMRFLRQVQPAPEMLKYVLTVLATFLAGGTEEQTFQIWTGSGSNGKSTVIELFEKALGDDYCGKFPVTLLTKDRASSNACTPELQDVMRKRFASMQEPEDSACIYTGAMKEYTGGDKIYSRGLYSTPTPFKPQFKLVLLCNKMPQIKGWDYGTWRRIRVVHFSSSFMDNPNPQNPHEYRKDKSLSKRFDGWREAFLWILIEHLKVYKLKGLGVPSAVTNASNAYKEKSDSLLQFVNETFVTTNEASDHVGCQECYDSYRMWAKNTNVSHTVNKNDFMDYVMNNLKWKRNGTRTNFVGISAVHQQDADADADAESQAEEAKAEAEANGSGGPEAPEAEVESSDHQT